MTKAQYIPIVLDGKRIGTAMIQNHHLVLSVSDKRHRDALWGEAEDMKLSTVEIVIPGQLSVNSAPQLRLHTKESGNTNG